MSLYDVRLELAEAVENAGVRVEAFGADKVVAPVVFIDEGSPYLAEGDVFKQTVMVVNYDLWLFTNPTPMKEATKNMDDMLEAVLFNLGDWTLTNLDGHFIAAVGDTNYLASKISITNQLEIGVA